jgi:hypothetical protein
MVLSIGLLGVAGMQINALRGITVAGSFSEGTNAGLSWAEWLYKAVNQDLQTSLPYKTNSSGVACNFVRLSQIDTNSTDDEFKEVEIPKTKALIVTKLAELGFVNEEGQYFTVQEVPEPPPSGVKIFLRVTAEVPAENMTTVEVRTVYSTGLLRTRAVTIRFVVRPRQLI